MGQGAGDGWHRLETTVSRFIISWSGRQQTGHAGEETQVHVLIWYPRYQGIRTRAGKHCAETAYANDIDSIGGVLPDSAGQVQIDKGSDSERANVDSNAYLSSVSDFLRYL